MHSWEIASSFWTFVRQIPFLNFCLYTIVFQKRNQQQDGIGTWWVCARLVKIAYDAAWSVSTLPHNGWRTQFVPVCSKHQTGFCSLLFKKKVPRGPVSAEKIISQTSMIWDTAETSPLAAAGILSVMCDAVPPVSSTSLNCQGINCFTSTLILKCLIGPVRKEPFPPLFSCSPFVIKEMWDSLGIIFLHMHAHFWAYFTNDGWVGFDVVRANPLFFSKSRTLQKTSILCGSQGVQNNPFFFLGKKVDWLGFVITRPPHPQQICSSRT